MFMQDLSRTAHSAVTADLLTRPVSSGMLAGTLVETATGWRGVETLRMGDLVQSLDGGLARVLAVDRSTLRAHMGQAVIALPGGAFDACSDLHLLPAQHLLIDTLGDAALPDDAFALIPALALQGHAGCSRRYLMREIEVITPMFAEEEILWANSGLLIHCPGIADGAQRRPDSPFFPCLDLPAARALLQRRETRLAA